MNPNPWPSSRLIELRTHSEPAVLLGLPASDLIAQTVQSQGGFEAGLADMALARLAAQRPGTVIDVGANIGTFAIPLALAAPQSRVLCFEAQRYVAYQLCGAVVLNGLARIHVHHLGVGEQEGTIEVTMPNYAAEPNVGAMSIDPEVNALRGSTTQGERESVRMIALDSLDVTDLRLLKIDVEGMELAVLRGATGLLVRNGFPPILAECWQNAWFDAYRAKLEAWFRSMGYVIQKFGDNYLATHPAHGSGMALAPRGPGHPGPR